MSSDRHPEIRRPGSSRGGLGCGSGPGSGPGRGASLGGLRVAQAADQRGGRVPEDVARRVDRSEIGMLIEM